VSPVGSSIAPGGDNYLSNCHIPPWVVVVEESSSIRNGSKVQMPSTARFLKLGNQRIQAFFIAMQLDCCASIDYRETQVHFGSTYGRRPRYGCRLLLLGLNGDHNAFAPPDVN